MVIPFSPESHQSLKHKRKPDSLQVLWPLYKCDQVTDCTCEEAVWGLTAFLDLARQKRKDNSA